jgi:hypothetical protein
MPATATTRTPLTPGPLVAVALALALAGPAHAAVRCKARANPKTGAVEVSARSLAGAPHWGTTPGGETAAFADASGCGRVRCHLGAVGTLAERTPPAECRVCVADAHAGCCALVDGCTPGLRPRDASFPAGDPRLAATLGPTNVTCPGATDQTDSDGDGVGDACEPYGIWVHSAGVVASPIRPEAPLDAFTFDPGGAATFAFREQSGALLCGTGTVAKSGRTALVADVSNLDLGEGRRPLLFLYGRPAADVLALSANGTQATFARAAALGPGQRCDPLNVLARFDGLAVVPADGSGLAFDGTFAWYRDHGSSNDYPVNPATGALGAPIMPSGVSAYSFLHAAEGATFWALCDCSMTLARRLTTGGGIADEVDTASLGQPIQPRAAAFDPVAGVLWVYGFKASSSTARLLSIDSAAEPDVLLGAFDLPVFAKAMTWDGTSLWLLTDFPQRLLQLDPTTVRVVRTLTIPDEVVSWEGIAAAPGGAFHLIGHDFDANKGVFITVKP